MKSITGGSSERDENGNLVEVEADVSVEIDGKEIYADKHNIDSTLTLNGSDEVKGKGIANVEAR